MDCVGMHAVWYNDTRVLNRTAIRSITVEDAAAITRERCLSVYLGLGRVVTKREREKKGGCGWGLVEWRNEWIDGWMND